MQDTVIQSFCDKSLPGKERLRWYSAWIRPEPSPRSASACSTGCTDTGFYWPSLLRSPWWQYVTGGRAQNSRGSTRPRRCWSRYSGGRSGGHTYHKYLIIWKYILSCHCIYEFSIIHDLMEFIDFWNLWFFGLKLFRNTCS